ncbi:MAG: hypothetical protein P4M11_07010 [Candidatus Pacebacteria bacterium]|nr:hypothetical protein [Candidatus Paceibacterota bacterium]
MRRPVTPAVKEPETKRKKLQKLADTPEKEVVLSEVAAGVQKEKEAAVSKTEGKLRRMPRGRRGKNPAPRRKKVV